MAGPKALKATSTPMSCPTPDDLLKVEVITSMERFTLIAAEWDSLWGAIDRASPYSSAVWIQAWWRHYGRPDGLRIIAVFRRGRLIGGWALWIRRVKRLRTLHFDVLTCLGAGGDTALDYLDPVIDPEQADEAIRGLKEGFGVASRGVAAIQLSEVAADVPWIRKVLDASAVPGEVRNYREILTIQLPSTWRALLDSFSKTRQRTISTRARRLERIGAVWSTLRNCDGLPPLFNALMELHKKRWSARTERHAFSSSAYIEFQREVMRALATRGALRLHSLELDGRIIAILYCFKHQDRIFYFQGGFDPQYSKLSPGSALFDFAIRSAVEEGAIEFDMLRGDYSFKQQWANSTRVTVSCTRYARGPLGLAMGIADRLGSIARAVEALIDDRPRKEQAPGSPG